ncbi:MAG TPA: helix-turn-helix domain-containing protein [Actinomycetes bacterium]|nr:helix-turn-helix domain-containing protein [Actinomycetes bacterium]
MHMVAVVVLPGAPIFELAVPCEVFGIDRRELADPWYELRLCTVEPGPTRVAAGFSVETAHGLEALAEAGTVIVPTCKDVHASWPTELLEALREAHARGARIAAICSGAFVLAAAGLLAGRRATTHWMHAEELSRRFPDVDLNPLVLYAQDGGIFTSAGTAAGLDLCIELVRQDHGAAVANMLARRIVVPPHRDGGQAQFVETPVPQGADSLAGVLDWALARLDQPLTLADLARAAHLSKRTLARRFEGAVGTTPMRWLLAQRVRRAQHLLEATDEPVERIAELAGFGSPANLRQHFSRATGVSPLSYRRTFRHRGAA